jgi:hypothetical protein
MTGRHENWNISMPSTIIMDGASFHKHEELRVYIEDEMGRRLLFLPVYSYVFYLFGFVVKQFFIV